jgi:hypothetical protein
MAPVLAAVGEQREDLDRAVLGRRRQALNRHGGPASGRAAGLRVIASAGAGPAWGRRPSELESGRRALGEVLPFHGGANPVDNSASWSGEGGALLATRPHQVDRR